MRGTWNRIPLLPSGGADEPSKVGSFIVYCSSAHCEALMLFGAGRATAPGHVNALLGFQFHVCGVLCFLYVGPNWLFGDVQRIPFCSAPLRWRRMTQAQAKCSHRWRLLISEQYGDGSATRSSIHLWEILQTRFAIQKTNTMSYAGTKRGKKGCGYCLCLCWTRTKFE